MDLRCKSRFYLAMVVVFGAALTLALALYALRANTNLFYTPSEILRDKGEDYKLPHVGQRLRIRGIVMLGRVKRDPQTFAGGLQNL